MMLSKVLLISVGVLATALALIGIAAPSLAVRGSSRWSCCGAR